MTSVVIGGLCWSGPLVEAARHGGGGNLWEIWLAFITPARLLGVTGIGRGLGAILDIPPLFLQDGTSPTRWAHGLDPTALLTVMALGLLWWRARARGLCSGQRLVSAAGVTVLAVAANAYRLPVETFTASHTMFARGAGAFVWFAGAAATLEITALTGVERWRLPVAVAGIAALVLELPQRSSSTAVAAGGTWLVAAVVIVCLAPLLSRRVALRSRSASSATRAAEMETRSGPPVIDIWVLRCLGGLAVMMLAVGVAMPPNLRIAYRAWIYDAIPPLDRQVESALPATRARADAFVVAATGGDRYRDVAKALISSLEGREIPTLVWDDLVQTYGSRRSYRAHQDKAAGEILVVPHEARHLPAGARQIASWRPRGWDRSAVRQLRNDISAFVRSHGRLTLTTEGHDRIAELLAYAVPAPADTSGSPVPTRYRNDPLLLATLPPEVMTNLYAERWAVATPQLPRALRDRLDRLVTAPAIHVWYLPAPLPAGTGVPG